MRLEQELAEAVQEDHESASSGGEASSRGDAGDEGSGSDSEAEGVEPGSLPTPVQNSLEMSVWSLDVSMPGGMESSVYETEVSLQ